jgi:hypothetical protein
VSFADKPVYSSQRLNHQIEIYFSILQRKALTPNDFPSLQALNVFNPTMKKWPSPFEWKFTRRDLNESIEKLRLAA